MKKLNVKLVIFTLPALAMTIACTKKLDYKTEFKEKVEEKSIISSEESYLYTASQGNSSRTNGGIRPHWKGEDKIVKFRFSEKELQVIETENDPRFQGNTANNKLLISIPVEYIEYHCAKDRYGQCTNKEEKNAEITWKQKNKFKPDFSGMKFSEANMLPAEMEKIFGGECYTEAGANVIDAKIDSDSINIQIEKTFRVNLECIKDATSLGDLLSNMTTTAVYHYSFTKLSSIASKDYTPVPYPRTDENAFGFFSTDQHKLDVDGNSIVGSKSELLNRWNPNRTEVVYYLADEFNKPENAPLKEATLEAFKRINRGLESAQVKFRLVAKDAEGRLPGDNRNSFVVLVEDPLAASILGYGPSVANPLTGEIVSAKVVMYSGVMKQFIRWTYEEIRRQQQEEKTGGKVTAITATPATTDATPNENTQPIVKIKKKAPVGPKMQHEDFAVLDLNKVKKELKSEKMSSKFNSGQLNQLGWMSKYCTYPAELFNFDETASNSLKNKIKGELEPWMKLSEEEKQSMIDIILPHVWIPTLVHEMGHNLGLRHNFNGSEDKENFYTETELKEMNIERPIPYSSVMDYPYTDLNHLPTLGKYDIAALRFGYQREVLTNAGDTIKVESTLEKISKDMEKLQKQNSKETAEDKKNTLRNYEYCTDEHVDLNAGCKRFDEGTTYTEIVLHQIKAYHRNQENRNRRNGRGNMSALEDHIYAERIWNTFEHMRLNLVALARIKNRAGIDYDAPEFSQIAWLKDLRQATFLSLQFLSNVILTPEVNCVIKNKKTNQVSAAPISVFPQSAVSCKDIPLKSGYEHVAEFGAFLNHMKDEKTKNPYVDQIDVRGIWIDKLLAAKALFGRNVGGLVNESMDNYFDLPEGQKILPALFGGLLSGKTEIQTDVMLPDGKTVKASAEIDLGESMMIRETLSKPLKKSLGLPERDFYFGEWILNYAKSALRDTAKMNPAAESLADAISVTKVNAAVALDLDPKTTKSIKISGNTFAADTKANFFSAQAIDQLHFAYLFKNPELRKEQVEEIIKAKNEKKKIKTKNLNAAEKAIAELPLEKIQALFEGKVPSEGYLIRLLNVMAK